MNKQTIEEQVASTVLQEKKRIKVGAYSFDVAPPTLATLILASKCISKIPIREFDKNITEEVFANAEDCEAFSELASILIIGAKRPSFWERFPIISYFAKRKQRKLAKRIQNQLSLKEVFLLIQAILKEMEFEYFFALTTFLSDINLLKKTREVVDTKK